MLRPVIDFPVFKANEAPTSKLPFTEIIIFILQCKIISIKINKHQYFSLYYNSGSNSFGGFLKNNHINHLKL